MKITVAKSDLEVALSVASIAVDGSVSDLTSHYLFRVSASGQGAEVLTADSQHRLFACAPFKATFDGEAGDAFTVEAWRLDKWMAGVADGVLELSFDGSGDVSAKGNRSRVRFRSLNPSKFPYWDKTMEGAVESGSVDPRTLTNALKFSKIFVSSDDTAKPELCQVEGKEGMLWATDRRGLGNVEVRSLPNLSLRIFGKEVTPLMKFLGLKETLNNPVTLVGAERSSEDRGGAWSVYKRPDGAYLGISRPTSEFPTLKVDRDAEPTALMSLNIAEFQDGVSILSAGAPKGHDAVTFSYDNDSGVVSISMPCEAGGQDDYPLSLAKVTQGGADFDTAFTIGLAHLNSVSGFAGSDDLNLGVFKNRRGGYISVDHSDEAENGNRYFGVVVWRT